MNHICKILSVFLLIFWHEPLFASTYLTGSDAEEGLRRGLGLNPKDSFVHGVGAVDVTHTLPDGSSTGLMSNGILLNAETIITSGHTFRKGTPTSASVTFYHDTDLVRKAIETAQKTNSYVPTFALPDSGGKVLADVVSYLDLPTAQYHEKQDVVVFQLMWPLPGVPILPLKLERPIALTPPGIIIGHVVSYAPICINGTTEPKHAHKRHLSALDLREWRVSSSAAIHTPFTFLAKDCIVLDKKLIAAKHVPAKPFAFTRQGDSGAPFFIPGMGVIGLNYGAATFTQDGTPHSLIEFIPLYLLKEWLLSMSADIKI